ncbi:MAG: phage holin family protein [Flavobacteriales bacterium]|nr:phage holin family protein [Flavobacteriales bacterium]
MNHQNNGNGDGDHADTAEHTDIGDFLNSTMAEGKAYFAAQKDYLELQAYEQVGKAAGGMFSGLLSAVTILMFLLFASVALAFWLGTLIGSTALGFLCVGGIYLLTFLIVHFMVRDSIRSSFMLNVINSFYDDKD